MTVDPSEKLCSKCKSYKPVSEFHRNASKKDGLDNRCRGCMAEYYADNRDRKLAYQSKYYRDNPSQKREYEASLGGMVDGRLKLAARRGVVLPGLGEYMRGKYTGLCECCSGPMVVKQTGKQGGGVKSPTWDRVFPGGEYAPGLVGWLCGSCNRLKSDMTPDEILKRAETELAYTQLANYVSKYSKT